KSRLQRRHALRRRLQRYALRDFNAGAFRDWICRTGVWVADANAAARLLPKKCCDPESHLRLISRRFRAICETLPFAVTSMQLFYLRRGGASWGEMGAPLDPCQSQFSSSSRACPGLAKRLLPSDWRRD